MGAAEGRDELKRRVRGEGHKSGQILRPSRCPLPEGEGLVFAANSFTPSFLASAYNPQKLNRTPNCAVRVGPLPRRLVGTRNVEETRRSLPGTPTAVTVGLLKFE